MTDSSRFMAEPPNVKLTVNGMPVEIGGTATVSDTNRRRDERVTFDAQRPALIQLLRRTCLALIRWRRAVGETKYVHAQEFEYALR